MTLVCAPAGSGKTVCLRSWAAQTEAAVAWVTVDRGERDAQRFWLSVIDALAEAAGGELIERVSPAPQFAGAVVVERLLEQLERLGTPLNLVLDDLHELASDDALAWLELLLARLPAPLAVVLATRDEPALGLHRLRLAGQLTELRGSDLRFSPAETGAVLRASGVSLSDAGVAALQDRTEGWPAGVRLATISLSTHPDPERFVTEFSGSERTVAGYLLAEVLERQPPDVRDMLLRTSILARVSGPLADALTGGTGAEAMLLRLDAQNAFVATVDATRTWFRYHHLFADLLRLELRRVAPAVIPSLHRAAAVWHEAEGEVSEAVRHYQAAGDWVPAGRLVIDNYLALTMAGRGETLHALLRAFPAGAHTRDCNLAAALAIDDILHGMLDEAATRLEIARTRAASGRAERQRIFNVYLAIVELELARRRSDLAAAQDGMRGLEAALNATADTDQVPVPAEYRALALMNLGVAELWAGHPDDARRHLEDALSRSRRIALPFVEVGCLAHLAMTAPLTGQPLPRSLELSERALAIADEHGWSEQPMTIGAFAMAGTALVRMGRFAEAERHLARADEALHVTADPAVELPLHHAYGMLRFGAGRFARSARRVRPSSGPGAAAGRRARLHGRSGGPGAAGAGADGRPGAGGPGARCLEAGTAQPRRHANRGCGPRAREGRPSTGRRGAASRRRRLGAGALPGLDARRGAAARRRRLRSPRRPSRVGGIARGGARRCRARRSVAAFHAVAEPRAARASSATPDRAPDADRDHPRHPGRPRR